MALAVALAALAAVRIWRWRDRRVKRFSQLRAQATERRRAERALLQTEVFYHSLVETIPQMILCKDLEGRFTFANQKFCAELGTTLEAIKGKTDLDFFPKELAEKYRADDQRVIDSGQVLDVVEQHVTPKGEKLYVQTMKTPLFGPDGEAIGIQGIFWDVTERMRAEEKLKEQNVTLQELARSEHQAHEALKSAQSRMVETEKLASLGQLVAGVAHEINNPLAFVSNNIAVLERDLLDLVALIGLYRRARDANDEERAALDVSIAELCEAARRGLLHGEPAPDHRSHARGAAADRAHRQGPPALRAGQRRRMERGGPQSRHRVLGEHGPGLRPQARRHGRDGPEPIAHDPLPRREAPSGGRQLADECHRRLPARGQGHDPHTDGSRGGRDPVRSGRYRLRHRSGHPRADLRPLLHHQADRRGDRPGPLDQLWDRPGARRDDRGRVVSGPAVPASPYGFPRSPSGPGPMSLACRPGRGVNIGLRRRSPMKLGLINSAWVQSGRGTSFGIHKTREIGFDAIDIFADPLDIDDAEKRLIKDECDAAGLPIVSVACVAVGLVDFNPSVQRFHVERVRAYLDMARQFEAKNVLLVLGEYIWQKEVIPPAEQWAAAVKNVRALGDHAGGLGLEIALELEPFHLSLLNDVASMVRFLTRWTTRPSRPTWTSRTWSCRISRPARSRSLRGRVAHVHISDCDGKVHGDLPPGRGVVDFPPYLEAIKELDIPEATISIELEYSPEPARIVEWVSEAYEKTAALMRAAGLRP